MLSLQPLYLDRSLINSVVNKARQSRSGDSVSCKWGGELIDLIKERDLKAKAKNKHGIIRVCESMGHKEETGIKSQINFHKLSSRLRKSFLFIVCTFFFLNAFDCGLLVLFVLKCLNAS